MIKKRNIIISFLESIYGVITPAKQEEAEKLQKAYSSFRAKARSQRTWWEIMADSVTRSFGSVSFAILHIIWFLGWLYINLGYSSIFPIFDPFPFGLLTMIVSLEAIFLSIIVLISQNRESQVNDLRNEIDFQVNTNAEREITKLIHLVNEIHDHLGLKSKPDREIEEMKKPLDTQKIEQEIIQEENNK